MNVLFLYFLPLSRVGPAGWKRSAGCLGNALDAVREWMCVEKPLTGSRPDPAGARYGSYAIAWLRAAPTESIRGAFLSAGRLFTDRPTHPPPLFIPTAGRRKDPRSTVRRRAVASRNSPISQIGSQQEIAAERVESADPLPHSHPAPTADPTAPPWAALRPTRHAACGGSRGSWGSAVRRGRGRCGPEMLLVYNPAVPVRPVRQGSLYRIPAWPAPDARGGEYSVQCRRPGPALTVHSRAECEAGGTRTARALRSSRR